jgi:LDH2 family malate/lactate/ureidoglycolate dehydrogenase
MCPESIKVNSDKLTRFVTTCFQKAGMPSGDAAIAAGIVVATDLRGIDSHGVARLNNYIKGLREGRIKPDPKTLVISKAPATAVMDGDHGLGFIVGYRAMQEAIRRADIAGAGFVTVRNSNHFGAGGNYSMMALAHDMIGISMTAGAKGMSVSGSQGSGAGINVLSIAAPANKETSFVLDMATTVVAAGKIEIAVREGKSLPEGWAVNRQGKPLTDPKKFREDGGSLLPLGGLTALGAYKGFGLTVAVDILCSVLSGSAPNNATMGNHFFGALRIDTFIPADEFKNNMDEMFKSYRLLAKAEGVERITLAGEPEREIEKKRKAEGIPLNPAVVASLQGIARDLGIEYSL